ncbi:MAG: SurA N-terminal domain-containing protein [Candidatus Cloacimonetes bacterium]|nr:SurA N-terminal domain-containing protein [Candidatus Cloacimonadota bacterium]
MKHLFLLLISALILASCSGPRGNSAGIINGTRISYPEYIRALQGNTIDFRSVTNRAPDDAEKRQIFNETWRNLSMRVILNDYYKKYDINVSEAEVLDSLSNNIPHFIRSSEVFFTDGKFDSELYQQSLRYDRPVNLSTLRNRYFNDHIPIQKLKPHIIDNELLSKKTRQNIASIMASTVDFDLLVFDPKQMNVVISEQELRGYYQQNLDKYAMEPIYSLSYLSLPITLQEIDLNYSYSVADSIYEEISLARALKASEKNGVNICPDSESWIRILCASSMWIKLSWISLSPCRKARRAS